LVTLTSISKGHAASNFVVKTKAAHSFGGSVNFYHMTQCHNSEVRILQAASGFNLLFVRKTKTKL